MVGERPGSVWQGARYTSQVVVQGAAPCEFFLYVRLCMARRVRRGPRDSGVVIVVRRNRRQRVGDKKNVQPFIGLCDPMRGERPELFVVQRQNAFKGSPVSFRQRTSHLRP